MKLKRKDILKFQKLYLQHYEKKLSFEEAKHRYQCLIRLIKLVREVPSKKEKKIQMEFKVVNNQSKMGKENNCM